MYTIAYRLHRDGHIEPFRLINRQIPTHLYFTVEDHGDKWLLRGFTKTTRKHLGYFTDQEDAEAVGEAWLKLKRLQG